MFIHRLHGLRRLNAEDRQNAGRRGLLTEANNGKREDDGFLTEGLPARRAPARQAGRKERQGGANMVAGECRGLRVDRASGSTRNPRSNRQVCTTKVSVPALPDPNPRQRPCFMF